MSKQDFKPILRFTVASDFHLLVEGDSSNTTVVADATTAEKELCLHRIKAVFDRSYRYASTQEYNKLDAVVIAGDYTDDGTVKQYDAFSKIVKEELKEGTKLCIAIGNHEFYDTAESRGGCRDTAVTYSRFLSYGLAETPDTHNVIKGFHFIGISPNDNGGRGFTEEKGEWLKKELAIAAADDPTGLRPIFVFQHQPIGETVYGSGGHAYTGALEEAMKPYAQIVDFSGHSHFPIDDPGSIFQGDYTLFATGTLCYNSVHCHTNEGRIFAMPLNEVGGWHRAIHSDPYDEYNEKETGQFTVIEVDADYRLRVLHYDITSDGFMDEPILVDSVGQKEKFTFIRGRGENSKAPAFEKEAKIELYAATAHSLQFTFPQAICKDLVRNYRCELYQNGKLEQTIYRLSNAFRRPVPQTLLCPFGGLEPETEYEVKIIPVSTWAKEGAPLCVTAKTPALPLEEGAHAPDVFKLAYDTAGAYNALDGERLVTAGDAKVGFDADRNAEVGVFNGKGDFQWRSFGKHYEILQHAITFETVAKLDADAEGTWDILSDQQHGGIGFEVKSGNEVFLYIYTSNKHGFHGKVEPGFQMKVGEYCHLAATFDGTLAKFYANGKEIASTNTIPDDHNNISGLLDFPQKISSQYLSVGADAGLEYRSECHMKGKVALANIYSKAMDAEEIKGIFARAMKK